MSAAPAGPLDGIRVLDFTIMMAGPYCSRLMADLGAEVIKIEPPEGDHIRVRPPLRDGRSTYFAQLNCGKRSLALDLRKREARETAYALALRSDVVIESFRPGVMRKLGLDYATLAPEHPRLVYCSISGFGQSGPDATRSAYAPILHAASGFDLAHLGYQDGLDRPEKNGIFIADVLGGALAFGGIQAALVARARTGRGDCVDLSLLDAMFGLLVYECQEAQFPAERRRALYQPVRALDGFVIVAPVSQNNFESMARAAGHPEWIEDPRFRRPADREHHWSDLMELLARWAESRTAEDCEGIMRAEGVPCSRYFTVREAMRQPQVRARGSFKRIEDAAGPFEVPNPPFRYATARAEAGSRVPDLGEDGEDVLREVLGFDEQRIRGMRECGALVAGVSARPESPAAGGNIHQGRRST